MLTKIKLEKPYCDRWRFGYLNINKEGRRTLALYNSSKDRSSCQYARYLMAVKIGRFLTENEEVDHIDNDFTNDSLDNLQILSAEENRNKRNCSVGVSMVEFECPICNDIFSRERRNTHIIIKSKKIITCSRKCGGKATHLKNIENPIRVLREWVLYKYGQKSI